MPLTKLLDGSTTNETGAAFTHKGGKFLWGVEGVTDGATVSLQASFITGQWIQIGDGTTQAQFVNGTGQMLIDMGPSPCRVRVVTTGGTESTQDIDSWMATAR